MLKRLLLVMSFSLYMVLPSMVHGDESMVDVAQDVGIDNRFVQNDIDAFLLQGQLQRAVMNHYYIPYRALNDDQQNLQDYLSYSVEAAFDEIGISNDLIIKMYQDQAVTMALYRRAEPYKNNERMITSVTLYGDEAIDKAAFNAAVLRKEFTVATQSWAENRSTTRVNMQMESERDALEDHAQLVIVEDFDEIHRPIHIRRTEGDIKTQNQYLYLTFEAYQQLDLDSIDADIIEVSASMADIAHFTAEDFEDLDSRVTLIVAQEIDTVGNAVIEWHYNDQTIMKRVSEFTYY